MPPGASRMVTPEIPLEIGSCSTVASFELFLPITFPPGDFSRANLNVGSSLPARIESGTLFMTLGSPASTRLVPTSAAVVAAANCAGPGTRFRGWEGGIGISLLERQLEYAHSRR